LLTTVKVVGVGLIYRRVEKTKGKGKTAEKQGRENKRCPTFSARYCGVKWNQQQRQQKDESTGKSQTRASKNEFEAKGADGGQGNGP
jgi:hypothetical protein